VPNLNRIGDGGVVYALTSHILHCKEVLFIIRFKVKQKVSALLNI
jgi:hypothetical protein